MDYKAPQPGQNGTPAPQYSQAAPAPQQYAQPAQPQQQQPQYAVQPHQQPQQQPQYAAQPQQQLQYAVHPQQAAAAQPQYQTPAPMQNAASAPAPAIRGGGWGSSLLDCSPADTCLLGTFLPCILIGQTSDRMRDPTMATADMLNSDCIVFTAIQCFTGCGWIHVMLKRGEIRQRYDIQGDGTSDCLATYCCPCCALIQQDKEVKVRTASAAAVVTQGYQAHAGMQMPQK